MIDLYLDIVLVVIKVITRNNNFVTGKLAYLPGHTIHYRNFQIILEISGQRPDRLIE